jgi:hypothetical protein
MFFSTACMCRYASRLVTVCKATCTPLPLSEHSACTPCQKLLAMMCCWQLQILRLQFLHEQPFTHETQSPTVPDALRCIRVAIGAERQSEEHAYKCSPLLGVRNLYSFIRPNALSVTFHTFYQVGGRRRRTSGTCTVRAHSERRCEASWHELLACRCGGSRRAILWRFKWT